MNNRTIKLTLYIFLIGLGITIVFWLFGENKMTWLRFINTAAMVGLAFCVIGGSMFVYYGGFFRGIAFSFRNFFTNKSDIYAQELSKSFDEYNRPNKKKNQRAQKEYGVGKKRPPINWAFIINALIFFIGSLILSYIIF